jgi:Tfp pilus assembly protein PilO
MIKPVFSEIAALRQEIVGSRKRVELFREVRDLSQNLSGLERDLAFVTDRSQLLGKISDIAGRTQLDFETLTPRTEPDGPYTRLRIEAEGDGSFFSLLKFLESVEDISAAIKVRDVSLLRRSSGSTVKGPSPLRIHLVFETFLKPRGKKANA